ncbi:hypothetical protein SDRG_12707 [Saprolegnia diclina VS20]|uniref:Uncharacterized protein n=1 Tax=Saprolegnia diclina (strain VS20) TaxID=1156394 RepID=T0RIM4_SAPDV|nr:hypothetical protein SDRG_12707 [Saprolegnia diclina VS20]EQC29707.1 hypothetical protein SDRG_12707 [Saprolegnia diclina VS20]|eukprot:XP_008617011.1 hypothetical protein SDRG_12707 [Saprolegnia diclina VS20]
MLSKIKRFSDVYHDTLSPRGEWPQICIGGICGLLSWPLPDHQARHLLALAGDNGVVPADKLCILNDAAWSKFLVRDQFEVLRNKIGGWSNAWHTRAVFSHLVVDDVGSAAALQAPRSDNNFGSLLIELPSAYGGGDLSYPHSADQKRQKAVAPEAARITVTLFDTKLSSAPITSVVLVYSLVIRRPVARPTQEAAIAALSRLAQASPLEYIACIQDETLGNELSFAALDAIDTTLVDVLVATGVFDVALVSFQRRFLSEPQVDSMDSDVVSPTLPPFENRVDRFVLHPACALHADGLIGLNADAFPARHRMYHRDDYPCPAKAVLFWPKHCRVFLLGFNTVLSLLQATVDDQTDADMVGCATARDLVALILPLFELHRQERHTTTSKATSDARYASIFGRLLLQIHAMDLVTRFVRDVIVVSSVTTITDVATYVHACLLQCGWSVLQMAFSGLLARWRVSDAMQLLSSLAGVALDPVCPPLAQPFAREFLKASWHALLPRLKSSEPTNTIEFASNCILLDWYVDEHAPNLPSGKWLSARLPPAMIVAVDAFCYPRHRHIDAA